jgi:hypothetical protein
MTTDRTLATRPAATPTDRPSSGAPEHRDGNAFAALLDAHAAPEEPRRPAARDDAQPVHRDDARPGPADDNGSPGTDAPPDAGDGATRGNGAASPGVDGTSPDRDPGGQPPLAAPAALGAPRPTADLGLLGAGVGPVVATTRPHDLVAAGTAAIVVPPVAGDPAPPTPVVAGAPQRPAALTVPAFAASAGPQVQLVATPVPAALDADAPAPAVPATPVPAHVASAAIAPAAPVAEGDAPAPAVPAAAPQPAAGSEPSKHTPAPAPTAAAAEPAPTAESQPAPVAPGSPSLAPTTGTASPERAVPLHRSPAAVATLLHVAAERGITHAKLALRPAELGGIEIRLQASAAGIAAQVVADSPEAARLLAQAGDDLRRALEAREVTLLSLEVSTSSEQRSREGARGEWTDRDGNPVRPAPGASVESESAAAPTATVIELPGGLLVDVLA